MCRNIIPYYSNANPNNSYRVGLLQEGVIDIEFTALSSTATLGLGGDTLQAIDINGSTPEVAVSLSKLIFIQYPVMQQINPLLYSYRYGFNGQEREQSINQSITAAEYWFYDGRLGRRWNVDPVDQLSMSNYSVLGNCPVLYNDVKGDNWYKNNTTGNYGWYSGNSKIEGYSDLGVSHEISVTSKVNSEYIATMYLNPDGTALYDEYIGENEGFRLTEIKDQVFDPNWKSENLVKAGTWGLTGEDRPQPTFKEFNAGFAFGGGIGFALGRVNDGFGDNDYYFTFNANLGVYMGAGFNKGHITVTDENHIFENTDFEGDCKSYSGGYGPLGVTYGGTWDSKYDYKSRLAQFNYRYWGLNTPNTNNAAYTFGSGGLGVGARAGAYYSHSKTWLINREW